MVVVGFVLDLNQKALPLACAGQRERFFNHDSELSEKKFSGRSRSPRHLRSNRLRLRPEVVVVSHRNR